ncbi:MAG: hypothetical protein ACFFAS_13770 [Promethearchaeota archaeon]
MSQLSEWMGFTELFEINRKGLIEFLHKQRYFLGVFEINRKNLNSNYEKSLINNAKNEIDATLDKIKCKDYSNFYSEIECEMMMKKIYEILKNLYEFVELEFLN